MLELILIIWLSIGFVISLATFLYTIYQANYVEITLEDIFALVVTILNGPVIGLYFLIEHFVTMNDVVLFKHHRRR